MKIFIFVLALPLIAAYQNGGIPGLLLVGIVEACLLYGIFWVFEQTNKTKENLAHAQKEAALAKCTPIIQAHLAELRRKRQQFTVDRGYGFRDTCKWDDEKKFFIQKVLGPKEISAVFCLGNDELSRHIDVVLDGSRAAPTVTPKENDPIAYEQYCGEILVKAGWLVSSTPVSGDQGADLIAKKYGRTVVIQCKQYKRPVGNKAVQEASAAKLHYGADAAVVVSNASYTRSAQELAGTTNVLLLHHDQLPQL